jgi:hypothetical protein
MHNEIRKAHNNEMFRERRVRILEELESQKEQ